MYSGTTLSNFSGNVFGSHQRVDRLARKQLGFLIKDEKIFPSSKQILQFEGKKGPDAIKVKSPAQDEPWHFYSPFDKDDSKIIELIKDHYSQLVKQLENNNKERVAFEAAWLAHALADGLTPAHHYPYEEKFIELSGGVEINERTSIRKKWFIPGDTRLERARNNWKMWGPKGLISTHTFFELGLAVVLMQVSFNDVELSREDLITFNEVGLIEWFQNTAREIAVLDIYDLYYQKGWTPKLANLIKKRLGPAVVRTVALAWYSALLDAGLTKPLK
jgi:hypothetical protein